MQPLQRALLLTLLFLCMGLGQPDKGLDNTQGTTLPPSERSLSAPCGTAPLLSLALALAAVFFLRLH